MIIYDIKCENGHKFEGWFKDRQAWIEQQTKRLVLCPVCSSDQVEIAPSSPAYVSSGSRAPAQGANAPPGPAQTLLSLHQFIDQHFEDVGNKFADVALGIHYGDEEKRNIKGTTTPQEEANLKEEGVQFVKISLPKMDS